MQYRVQEKSLLRALENNLCEETSIQFATVTQNVAAKSLRDLRQSRALKLDNFARNIVCINFKGTVFYPALSDRALSGCNAPGEADQIHALSLSNRCVKAECGSLS